MHGLSDADGDPRLRFEFWDFYLKSVRSIQLTLGILFFSPQTPSQPSSLSSLSSPKSKPSFQVPGKLSLGSTTTFFLSPPTFFALAVVVEDGPNISLTGGLARCVRCLVGSDVVRRRGDWKSSDGEGRGEVSEEWSLLFVVSAVWLSVGWVW